MSIFKFLLATCVFLFVFIDIQSKNNLECDECSGKCGTHLMFTPEGREQLQRTIYWENEIPKVGQKSTISANNIFKVHYDTVGYHAPPMADINRNGVPDYVDSVCFYFDFVYDRYINQLGFRSPYPDKGSRGSDHYDVYLWDLGNSDSDSDTVQGYHIGGTYGSTYSSNRDVIISQPFARMYSYIIIDNDFASTDSVRKRGLKPFPAYKYPGIPSLKVTIAHEFFHAIQFVYGVSQPANITVMEMNAVAMERVFFPEIKDYLIYVRALFKNPSSYPFGIDNQNTGYGHSIFNQFLIENFGIGMMKTMWEKVADGNEVYSAIDLTLKDLGSDLKSSWCKFIEWAYYTGSRSVPGMYFSNAEEIPSIEPFSVINFTPPSGSNSGNMAPLEFRFLRFFFPAVGDITDDTLDILIGNIDLKSASSQVNISRNYFWQVASESISGSKKIDGLNYWLYDEIDSNYLCHNMIVSAGGSTVEIGYPYPNPLRISIDDHVLFPAPSKSAIYSKVILIIYSSDMVPIYSETLPVTVNNRNKVVLWNDIPDSISSGTYIFGIHQNENTIIGKFAIIKD